MPTPHDSCPPDQGFGKCFNVDNATLGAAGGRAGALHKEADGFLYCSDTLVAAFPTPRAYCPALGRPQQCVFPGEAGAPMCGARGGALPNCTKFPGAAELASASCSEQVPDAWQANGDCWWTEGPCHFNPYYPP